MLIRKAFPDDAQIIKNLVNEMYGIEYEKRKCDEIAKRIEENAEIYILALLENEIVGFAGATVNYEEYKSRYGYGTVIDYVYVKDLFRGLFVAYHIMKNLLNEIISLGINSAIMQVQTFNKQRYLHYALSDKNIISTTICESRGQIYEDQILLIADLKEAVRISIKEIVRRIAFFQRCEEKKDLN